MLSLVARSTCPPELCSTKYLSTRNMLHLKKSQRKEMAVWKMQGVCSPFLELKLAKRVIEADVLRSELDVLYSVL